MTMPRTNTSGMKGICHYLQKDKRCPGWEKECWYARICVNGKTYTKTFSYTDEGLKQAKEWHNKMCIKYHKEFARTNDMIQNQEKILAELNLIINSVDLPIHYNYINNSTGYSNVTTAYFKNRNIKYYSAYIKINDEKYCKLFRFNSAGKILAAEYINQILLQHSPLGKDDKRFNRINYNVISAEELQAERDYMQDKERKNNKSK